MAQKQKNYTVRLVKGMSYRSGPGKVYYPGKPVVVGEKEAAQLHASGHFKMDELKAAAAPKSSSKKSSKSGSKKKGDKE